MRAAWSRALLLLALLPGLPAAASPAPPLWGGSVTYCTQGPIADMAAAGATGQIEADRALAPSMAAMNDVLAPFGRTLAPGLPGQPEGVPARLRGWDRLCATPLPPGAREFARTSYRQIDPYHDMRAYARYPRAAAPEGWRTLARYWFVGDRLVHVEVKALPNPRL